MIHHIGLRKMLVTDAAVVHAIDQSVNAAAWSEKLYGDCVNVGYECWVVYEEHDILGFGVLSFAANEAHILNIGITPNRQGQGLGRKILQHLLDRAKIQGAIEVFLEVRPSNTVALSLYNKFNFIEIGIRKEYYPADENGVKEDALTLALPLV